MSNFRTDAFEYKKPSDAAVALIRQNREACKALSLVLLSLPDCREKSLALTKLEEVSMWANKAISFEVTDAAPDASNA